MKTSLRCTALLFLVSMALQAQAPGNSDWPEYGGTLSGQRYAAADQIDRTNVGQLKVAWTFHTHALDGPPTPLNGRAFFEATPILWDGTLFFETPFNKVFALDAKTGRQRWSFDPKLDVSKGVYILAARGVALWHAPRPQPGPCGKDRLLLATLDRRLIAVDAKTGVACHGFGNRGEVDLSQGVDISREPMKGYPFGGLQLYFFTSPPTVVGQTVVLGSSIGDNQAVFEASGAVRGFDVTTGRQKWSWEPLRSADNQKPDSPASRRTTGSGNAWSILSADPERDMVFVPTGSPSVDFYGGGRLGDNRDANSIVALRASTGERLWAYQLVHHDLWDYDVPSQPMLFQFRGNIPAVAVTTKQNMVFVFNRLTGAPLYPIEERPVPQSGAPGERTSPTQPFSSLPSLGPLSITADDIHLHNAADQQFCRDWLHRLDNRGLFTPPSFKGSLESPGNAGGVNWGSSAFNPDTGVLYTRVSMMPYIVRLSERDSLRGDYEVRMKRWVTRHLPESMGGVPAPPPPLGNQFPPPDHGSSALDEDPQYGAPFVVARQALVTADGTPCGVAPFGTVVALNLNTGQKEWTVPNGEMVKGEAGSYGTGGVMTTAGGLVFGASSFDPHIRAYDATNGKTLWQGDLPASANATPMSYTAGGQQFVVIAVGGNKTLREGQSDSIVAFALPKAKTGAHR